MEVTTVVVPSAGRRDASLRRALRSVGDQTYKGLIDIILVDDSPEGRLGDLRGQVGNACISVIRSVPEEAPRWTGVRCARDDTAWFAFLDDDDWWAPTKLERQIAVATDLQIKGHRPVVSCFVDTSGDPELRTSRPVPTRTIRPGQDVAEYLFRRRGPSRGRSSIFTSTILTSRAVALEVPWRRVRRHQDWDWLIRAQATAGVIFTHVPEVLVGYSVGSDASISASPDWRASLDWADSVLRHHAAPAAYADFLASQTLRYAIAARSASGVAQTLRAIGRSGRLPSMRACLSGAAGVVPRRHIERVLRGRPADSHSVPRRAV